VVHLTKSQHLENQKHRNDLYRYDYMSPLKMCSHTGREKNGCQLGAIRQSDGGFEMTRPLYLNRKNP
jgi:hypothetical protein